MISELEVGSKILLYSEDAGAFVEATVTKRLGSSRRPSSKVGVVWIGSDRNSTVDLMQIPFVLMGKDPLHEPAPSSSSSQPFDPSVLIPKKTSVGRLTLADYGFSIETIGATRQLLDASPELLNRFETFLRDLLSRILDASRNTTELVKEDIEWARSESTKIFLEVAPHLMGRINQGDPPNEDAILYILANYAPWSCLAHRDKGETPDHLCAMWRLNACLRMMVQSAPKSLVGEAGGEWNNALAEVVNKAITIDDYNPIVPKTKGDEERELDDLCLRLGVPRILIDAFSAAKGGLRAKLCLLNGRKLSALYVGNNARNRVLGTPAMTNPHAMYVHGGVLHPEALGNKTYALGAYLHNSEEYLAMNAILLSFYKSIPALASILDKLTATFFMERRAGLLLMSLDEIEEERKRLFGARSAGGKASAERFRQIRESDMDDLSEGDIAWVLSRHERGFEQAERFQQIRESDMDDLSEGEIAWVLSQHEGHQRYHRIMETQVTDTSGGVGFWYNLSEADWTFMLSRFDAGHTTAERVQPSASFFARIRERQAETVAGVGLSIVDRPTRNNPTVPCVCPKCSGQRDSLHTIQRSKVGHVEREVEEYDVDENFNMIGEPVRIHANLNTAAKNIPLTSVNTIRSIVQDSEDGGLLPESRYNLANGEKRPPRWLRYGAWEEERPPRWLRYVPRRPNMIVVPQCKEIGCGGMKPLDPDLRIRVDYVNYRALREKWQRKKAKELQELCNELGISVKAGLSAAELRKELDKHYNDDERKRKRK